MTLRERLSPGMKGKVEFRDILQRVLRLTESPKVRVSGEPCAFEALLQQLGICA